MFQTGFIDISEEGAIFLIEKGVKRADINYLSVEGFESSGYKLHHLLFRNQVVISLAIIVNFFL